MITFALDDFYLLFHSQKLFMQPSKAVEDDYVKDIFTQFKFHLLHQRKPPKQTIDISCQFQKLLAKTQASTRRTQAAKQKLMREKKSAAVNRATTAESKMESRMNILSVEGDTIGSIQQAILLQNFEREKLQEQIESMQASHGRLKKRLESVRGEVQQQEAKEESYKTISYLSKSVERQTSSIRVVNKRGFREMVLRQEEALSNLKKYRTTLNKEKEQIVESIAEERKTTESKVKPKTTYQAATKQWQAPVPRQFPNLKNNLTFMDDLEPLLKLFKSKEIDLDRACTEEITGFCLARPDKSCLHQSRAQFHEAVEKFEDKYSVKIESLPQLIELAFQEITEDNDSLEKECLKLNSLKENLLEEEAKLKQRLVIPGERQSQEKWQSQEGLDRHIRGTLRRNSQMQMRVLMLLYFLLEKFRYLFAVVGTLSCDRKPLQECILRMKALSHDSMLRDKSPEFQWHDAVNQMEVADLLNKKYRCVPPEQVSSAIQLLFTDIRVGIILRRSWLEGESEEDVLGITAGLVKQCQQVYDGKLKYYYKLFVDTMQTVATSSHEKCIIANSSLRQNTFMYRHITCGDPPKEEESLSEVLNNQSANGQIDGARDTGKSTRGDHSPRQLLNQLLKMKNEEERLFKTLHCKEKQIYLYNNQIALPFYDD